MVAPRLLEPTFGPAMTAPSDLPILFYYAQGTPLWPEGTWERAQVLRWMERVSSLGGFIGMCQETSSESPVAFADHLAAAGEQRSPQAPS